MSKEKEYSLTDSNTLNLFIYNKQV